MKMNARRLVSFLMGGGSPHLLCFFRGGSCGSGIIRTCFSRGERVPSFMRGGMVSRIGGKGGIFGR